MKPDIGPFRSLYAEVLILTTLATFGGGASLAADFPRAAAEPIAARVVLHEGRPTLFLNDRPTLPQLYALSQNMGMRWTWEEVPRHNIGLFAKQGIRLFQVGLELDQMWTAPDRFDIDVARRQIRGILEVCPDAAVMFRLHVNSPTWWNKAHPEECVRYADAPVEESRLEPPHSPLHNDLRPVPRQSIASRLWQEQCGEKVGEFCRQLARTPEGDALFAIQIAAGVYGEWHYYAFLRHEPDTGPAMTSHFRRWLRGRYGNDRALQAAWSDPNATLATAVVPGVAERLHTSAGYFRDPRRERRVIDYFRCQHESVTEAFIHFCRIVKENWPRPIVTGGFHGYWFKMFGRMAAGGHLEVERALNSPVVDFLSAPQTYGHLGAGQSGLSRGVLESCRLHGKLFFDEMDTLPAVWRVNSPMNRAEKAQAGARLAESVAVLRRNVMQSFCRGMGMWYYELPAVHSHHPTGTALGLWDHPELLPEIARMYSVQSEYFSRPFESAADVLVVFDTESFYFLGHNKRIDPISTELLDGTTEDLLHAGAAVDMIYLFDLDRVDLRRYKAVIFANLFKLDAKQRELIGSKVARDGRHLIWQCAPGYTDGRVLAPENVSEVVGMTLKSVRTPTARVSTDAPGVPQAEFGLQGPLEPLLVVEDAAATPLGRLKDSKQVTLARKSLGSSTTWFSSLPLRNPKLLRFILKQAGVHLYSEQGDVVYAGNGLIMVHAADGAKRTLTLRNGKKVELEPPLPSTLLLDGKTGELLLP